MTSSVTVSFLKAWTAACWTVDVAAGCVIHCSTVDFRAGLAASIASPMLPIIWKRKDANL